jgi:hypothetical protein
VRRHYSTAKQQVAKDRLHRSRVEIALIQHDGNIICNRDGISGSVDVVDVFGEDLVGWFIRMRTAPRKKRGQVSLEAGRILTRAASNKGYSIHSLPTRRAYITPRGKDGSQ